MRHFSVAVLLVALCVSASQANLIHKFKAFDNNGQFVNIPGLDMSVEVYQSGTQVAFKFTNDTSVIPPVITDIYFQDGVLLDISELYFGNQTGVHFNAPATPRDLPNGNAVNFTVTRNFSADSDSQGGGVIANGLAYGEWLVIKFSLKNNGTVNDVLSQLQSGDIRVGMHVQNFTDGSKSMINIVPEPATLALLGFGAIALRRLGRK